MESNKSKGVGERQDVSIHPLANTYTDGAAALKWYNELSPLEILHLYRYSLAHPQQSEGVGQAAEGLSDTEIADLWERHGMFGSYDGFVSAIKEVTEPSEPAALKEPQGSPEVTPSGCEADAPAVVITDGEIEGTIRQLWEKWQFEGKVFYHEFEFALKEFASLLTNHKS